MKQDELRTGYAETTHWLSAHRDDVRVTAIAVAVLALAALALTSWRTHQREASEKAFSEAFEVFHAPVAAEIPPGQQATGTVHATAQDRYTKAKAAFEGVGKRYGSTSAGRRSRYYTALCDIELGRAAEAEKELHELAKGDADDVLVPGLARLALAESLRRRGQVEQAVEAFRRLADEKTAGVPPDHALMRLATTLEDARRSSEAGAAYQRLVEEFPSSVYAAEARRKATDLGSRG